MNGHARTGDTCTRATLPPSHAFEAYGDARGRRMRYSRHGAKRAQQRAIDPLIIDWLIAYGTGIRTHGATRYFLEKDGRRRLERDIGSAVVGRLADKLSVVAVVSDDGLLVTAYHRCERVRRP